MRPPYLLDTCACIWAMDNKLRPRVEKVLTEAYNAGEQSFVSPITAFEIGLLALKGRFKSHLAPHDWFKRLVNQPGFALADMPPELMIESTLIPGDMPPDPYDRIIAVTAREYELTVVTRDAALLDYGAQGHLSVLEC